MTKPNAPCTHPSTRRVILEAAVPDWYDGDMLARDQFGEAWVCTKCNHLVSERYFGED